jgi:hypothetical protein
MKDILAKSLLNKVERLEVFEERLSVRFENTTIKVDDDGWVSILFELHSNKGTTLDSTIVVECTAYDIDGQILGIQNNYAIKDRFFGFEVFELRFAEDKIADRINKLRLYPKKQ